MRKWGLKLGSIPYKLLCKVLGVFVKKQNRALVISNVKVEDNAISMANFLAAHYQLEVDVMLPAKDMAYAKTFLNPRVHLHPSPRHMCLDWASFKRLSRAKYVFLTYQFLYGKAAQSQKYINLWHGLTYKKIQRLRPYDGILVQADYTVAGSEMTRKMNATIFGVPQEQVLITGLPRNDLMLRSRDQAIRLRKKLHLNTYRKILIWMPTYRRSNAANSVEVRKGMNALFGVENFAVQRMNRLLEKNNAICLLKTHHAMGLNREMKPFGRIQLIDDNWLKANAVLLYEFLACTDALISDYSSVMIDYMLLDKPIFCLATDVDNYRRTQGLCFSEYKNWVPSKLYEKQDEFFEALAAYLETDVDIWQEKRRKLCSAFFLYQDAHSAKRVAEAVLELD